MSIIDSIADLMIQEGNIKAQQARERIAMEEEKRQAKHRVLRGTLKALATIGPYFIPGAGIIPAIAHASKAISIATKFAPLISTGVQTAMRNPSVDRWDEGPADQFERVRRSHMPLPSRQTVPFALIPPWDEEGIG